MHQAKARHFNARADGTVECVLCPHLCVIADGRTGICGVRKNARGELCTTIYGEITGMSMDPIEKKPLYHFHPGSSILSIGTKGCNFKCSYCQNWHISQDVDARSNRYDPDAVVKAAIEHGSVGVAYTYSEPFIWFEYTQDCARRAREAGLKNVYVTNGFINPGPLDELLEYADAMNIDLKAFREDTYKKVQKGRLAPVLDSIRRAHGRCHVELTTLVVTGMNDDMDEMRGIIDWIAALDKNIPWHVSRYHPSFKYDAPPTDTAFLRRVCEEAAKKLSFVYCGNVAGGAGFEDTKCPSCGATVIERRGYRTKITALKQGACAACGHVLGIIG
jgi:pyruvate formate lyase activating enzyme